MATDRYCTIVQYCASNPIRTGWFCKALRPVIQDIHHYKPAHSGRKAEMTATAKAEMAITAAAARSTGSRRGVPRRRVGHVGAQPASLEINNPPPQFGRRGDRGRTGSPCAAWRHDPGGTSFASSGRWPRTARGAGQPVRWVRSYSAMSSSYCRVQPISSRPFRMKVLRKGSTSNRSAAPSGSVTTCRSRSTETV